MIVVDSSAIVAAFAREPESAAFVDFLEQSQGSHISSASVLETSIGIRSRKTIAARLAEQWLDDLLRELAVAVEPVLVEDMRLARAAHVRFGKGTGHPAQLNYGDCFSYALAKRLGVPLLFKGSDFVHTDVASAL